jgi:hypothetical protein
MISLRFVRGVALAFVLAACSKTTGDSGPRAIPGYVHTLQHSRFILGDILQETDQYGMHKVIGTVGTFNTFLVSQAVMAVPNETLPDLYTQYFPDYAGAQDAEVRSYFVSVGMPSDQVVQAGPYPAVQERIPYLADGGLDFADAVSNTCWTTNLHRAYQGIPIVDSIAWAILQADGASAEEYVYWPEIGADVVSRLDAFQQMLDNTQQRAAFVANLPTAIEGGQLIIRHTANYWQGQFVAEPCYRATFAGVALCFDISGNVVQLPDGSSTLSG